MVKINVCPDCFPRVRRAPMGRIPSILGACPKCKAQVQAVQVAKVMNRNRVTFGDVVDVLRRSRL